MEPTAALLNELVYFFSGPFGSFRVSWSGSIGWSRVGRTMKRASWHAQWPKHDIACIPSNERERNKQPDQGEIGWCMSPFAFPRSGRSRFGWTEVWLREFLRMSTCGYHLFVQDCDCEVSGGGESESDGWEWMGIDSNCH